MSRKLYVVSTRREVEKIVADGRRSIRLEDLRQSLLHYCFRNDRLATMTEWRAAAALAMGREFPGSAAPIRSFSALSSALMELGQRGLLSSLSRSASPSRSRTNVPLQKLRTIHQEAERLLLEANLLAPWTVLQALARRLHDVSPIELISIVGTSEIEARWILHWHPVDLEWWRALTAAIGAAGSVDVALPMLDRPLDAEREKDPLEVLYDHLEGTFSSAPTGESIRSPLGSFTIGSGALNGARVSLTSCVTRYRQAVAAVSTIRRHMDLGLGTESMAVVSLSENTRAIHLVARELEASGIPVDDRTHRPSDAPTARQFISLYDQILSGLSRRQLADLLSTGLLGGDDAAEHATIVDALLQNPTASGTSNLEQLIHTVERAGVEADRTSALRSFLETLDGVRTGKTRQANLSFLENLLQLFARGASAPHLASQAAKSPLIERFEEKKNASLGELAAALHELRVAGERLGILDAPVDARALRWELGALLDQEEELSGNLNRGVLLGHARTLGDVQPRVLVVLDADEETLDAWMPPNPFLSPDILRLLAARGTPSRHGSRTLVEACHLGSLAILARACEEVEIVIPQTNDAGQALSEAPFVTWLRAEGCAVSACSDASTSVTARLEALRGEGDFAARAKIQRMREAVHGQRKASTSPCPTRTPEERHRHLLESETGAFPFRPLSISSLEEFATCNFRGFASAILRARKHESSDEELSPLDHGKLLHEALECAFVAAANLWPLRPRPSQEIRSVASRAIAAALHKASEDFPVRSFEMERVHTQAMNVVDRALADLDWDFALAEQRFGSSRRSDARWDALSVSKEPPLFLSGQIDRVDRRHDGGAVRVVDYKSSRTRADALRRRIGATSFQLPAYLEVASHAFGVPGEHALFVTGACGDRTLPVTETTSYRVRALEIVQGVRAGDVTPRAQFETDCDTCTYQTACRRPRFFVTEEAGTGEDD